MKAVVDVRMEGKGGIGTYVSQLTKRLNMERLNFSAPIYSAKEQLLYPFKVPKCDLFFSPHFNVPIFPLRAKKQVVTIHDVYHLDHPDLFPKLRLQVAKRLYSHATVSSDLVITVSEFSKRRILEHFPHAKIEVIPLGADHLLGVDPIEVTSAPSFFYLFVGSMKPHKNRRLLDGLPVIDVLGQYSHGELVWLYNHAEALIFPSLYEGFGLPPLEAMSLRCPVIAADAASIAEVCQDAALYFEPKSYKSLENVLHKLPSSRRDLIKKGFNRSSQLTWEMCAKRHHDLFRSI